MSFLKKLFGGGEKPEAPLKRAEHKGFVITAMAYSESGQYQTCGLISKDIEGVRREHKFIRADRFASLDEAQDFSLSKGRQIVDDLGDKVFN